MFAWAKKSDVHPLVKSFIVHFEIEFIHPFIDGNGRIGLLWQTLNLVERTFCVVACKTFIYENQQGYYNVLETAQKTGNSEVFNEFMLNVILQALEELPSRKLPIYLPI